MWHKTNYNYLFHPSLFFVLFYFIDLQLITHTYSEQIFTYSAQVLISLAVFILLLPTLLLIWICGKFPYSTHARKVALMPFRYTHSFEVWTNFFVYQWLVITTSVFRIWHEFWLTREEFSGGAAHSNFRNCNFLAQPQQFTCSHGDSVSFHLSLIINPFCSFYFFNWNLSFITYRSLSCNMR